MRKEILSEGYCVRHEKNKRIKLLCEFGVVDVVNNAVVILVYVVHWMGDFNSFEGIYKTWGW